MHDINYNWDPNEWEEYVHRLLQDRYGFLEIDKVPAQHRDFGIDYLCKKYGIVFQCYSVQEPVTTADRAQKQESKITADIKKFCKDCSDLRNILGVEKIKHWVLVVPLHNSAQVNAHLSLQARKALSKNLQHIAPDFKLSVHDLSSFSRESRNKHIKNLSEISIPIEKVTALDVLNWHIASDKTLINNLTIKLSKKRLSSSQSGIDSYIKFFLEQQNTLDYLRDSAPQLYEIVNKTINSKLTELDFAGPYTIGDANSILREQMTSLKELLTNNVNNLDTDSANAIVFGTLSQWMMLCPLDFPPYH